MAADEVNDAGDEAWPGFDGHVKAAGGLPWRMRDDHVVEVLLVHRPKYDDWTFPKGKLDPGESFEQAAHREVEEETGLRGVLGRELPPSEYVDGKGRPKVVRYWEMTITEGDFLPNDEVDEIRWLPVDGAEALLTYERDRVVLECFRQFAGVQPAP
jgi:8-oxo-dGTP diphosphatase